MTPEQEAKEREKFEEWFDGEAYLLQFSLVPPKVEIDKIVKGWMLEAYLQACKVRGVETERKKSERGQFSKELILERMKVIGLKKEIDELREIIKQLRIEAHR